MNLESTPDAQSGDQQQQPPRILHLVLPLEGTVDPPALEADKASAPPQDNIVMLPHVREEAEAKARDIAMDEEVAHKQKELGNRMVVNSQTPYQGRRSRLASFFHTKR